MCLESDGGCWWSTRRYDYRMLASSRERIGTVRGGGWWRARRAMTTVAPKGDEMVAGGSAGAAASRTMAMQVMVMAMAMLGVADGDRLPCFFFVALLLFSLFRFSVIYLFNRMGF